jgi:hypothetical protein
VPSFSYAARVRVGAVVLALVYAVLAVGNGLDRMAFAWPAVAPHLPAWFATDALEVTGEADLRRDPHAAVALAARLVARAPIEPFSTALLGAGRAANGDDAGADRAFRVAGQLGWRIPLTQSYLLDAALDAGDMRVAAQRLDALLRLQPDLLHTPAVLAPFEEDDAARAALVDRLATRPPWLGWYTGEMDPVPAATLARRVPSLLMLGDRGVILGCAAIAPAVRQLASAGLTGPAEALQRKHCQ